MELAVQNVVLCGGEIIGDKCFAVVYTHLGFRSEIVGAERIKVIEKKKR